MKVNVYLPDEIGGAAKAAEPELNLSRLLRDAVEDELARRRRLAALADGAKEFELPLVTDEGASYTGVLSGTQITEEDPNGFTIYLADDGRVIAHDGQRETFIEIQEAGDPNEWRSIEDYLAVCDALGEKPEPVRI